MYKFFTFTPLNFINSCSLMHAAQNSSMGYGADSIPGWGRFFGQCMGSVPTQYCEELG